MHISKLIIFSLLIFNISFSQTDNHLKITRINSPVNIDGKINEQEWLNVKPVKMVMFLPTFNQAPTEQTEVRLVYDDEFLYVAANLNDQSPDKIQITSNKRDAWNLSNDIFGIMIDTFNDKENGLCFYTNPAGSRWDFTVYNDASGGFPVNISWNTFWEVESSIDENGWNVEMRIPLNSLRFNENEGKVTMGIIPWRWIARKNESSIYPAIPNKWGWWSQIKPSQAKEIVLEGVQSKNPLYIAPYISGGLSNDNDLNDAETKYVRDNNFKSDIGLDIKYGITSNLTMDLTINTDFAQVEADDQQINLTRFSLFFPEKRLFFQERAAIFDFQFGGPNRLFYSRRIGLDDEGIQVPIIGGARLIGRIGQWDLGFLDMQTSKSDSLPSENFGVLRLRRQVINDNSFVGALLTNRYGKNGDLNSAVGIDGIFRVSEDDYFSVSMAHTYETDAGNEIGTLDQMRFLTFWEKRRFDGFNYELSYSFEGENYRPGMGFSTREDYSRIGGDLGYGWIMDEKSWLQRHNVSVNYAAYQRNSDKSIETAESELEWNIIWKNGFNGSFSVQMNYEDITDTLEFSDDAEIIPGSYDFYNFSAGLESPSGELIGANTGFTIGRFYDGTQLSFGIEPRWNISADFSLGLGYEFNKLDFSKRNQDFTAHILRLRSSLSLSTSLSLSGFVQYNSAANLSITNARLRYNPAEGNDLYIVYNEDFNSKRRRELPYLPRFNNRTLLLKYTYTFVN
ncbi:MAG: hypothetical protein D8M58_16400 [Calditrichaeota bacterium]|nr:MAG: hypothetical protein DWQ03_08130 [Calditrichota bacterium]MBL1206988.1 hypothetical protein [Calditrichota bacterium]NOG46815.1 carbohydrate binding family 9 domain-containing protein [Calditrichota bacterium]